MAAGHTKWVVDGYLVYKRPNVFLPVLPFLLSAIEAANMEYVETALDNKKRLFEGIETAIITLGTMRS